ncbi:MAG: hypothetical protein PUE58_02885 [Lachnospiraceae bacterium]|nr:hypothetical protein [Lachnospiraceae bacterium]
MAQLNITLDQDEILQSQFHFSKNIADKAPKKMQAGLRAELQEMFNCKKSEDVRKKRDQVILEFMNEKCQARQSA